MNLPHELLLSDLLHHRVRCDQGIDHGTGSLAWMHPPVHRILGWASKPSSLRLSRHVWRLNQLRGFSEKQLFVKGSPSITDQTTLDRIPTLLDAELLNIDGDRLGLVVDFIFNPNNGNIKKYLVSRSDPRIPGTSRWSLNISKINDQQPGIVSTSLKSLDDLPLVKSSIRQDFLKKSRTWRSQIQEISDKATNRLEGWLEEPPWDDFVSRSSDFRSNRTEYQRKSSLNSDIDSINKNNYFEQYSKSNDYYENYQRVSPLYDEDEDEEEDPWI